MRRKNGKGGRKTLKLGGNRRLPRGSDGIVDAVEMLE